MNKRTLNRRELIKIVAGFSGLMFWTLDIQAQSNEESSNGGQGLERARERWSQLSDQQKELIKKRWKKFQNLPPEKRKRLLAAFKRFRSMTPAQRRRLRKRFKRFKSLPKDRRRRIRQRFSRWRSMSPQQRQRIRSRYDSLTPRQRRILRRRLIDSRKAD